MQNDHIATESPLKKRTSQPFDGSAKVGIEKLKTSNKQEIMKAYFRRKIVLTVPEELEKANPDKQFAYLRMQDLEKDGMYNPEGWRLFKVEKDPDAMHDQDFNKSVDGLVHRREMVLVYMPKEEYELRKMEEQIANSNQNIEEVLTQKEALKGYAPHAKITDEVMKS